MNNFKIVKRDKNAIAAIKKQISNKPEGDYSIQSLTISAGINRTKLSKLFKIIYRISIHQYVIHQRIKKAKQLLANTDQPIKAISMECGYKSPKNFATAFKKITGKSPLDYERMHHH